MAKEKDDDLQVENGNYTRIVNRVLDELAKAPLLAAELAVCLFVIRKTYGFHKTEDEISLSQIQKGTGRSRPTVVKALKNLKLVKVLELVKLGSSKKQSNIWRFNKYYKDWKLVKTPELVKYKNSTGKVNASQLVKTPLHTKETKYKTKETPAHSAEDIAELIDLFQLVNPTYKKLFGSPPQRRAADRLLTLHPLEYWRKFMPAYQVALEDRFCPKATTPLQMENKLGEIEIYGRQRKAANIKKSSQVVL